MQRISHHKPPFLVLPRTKNRGTTHKPPFLVLPRTKNRGTTQIPEPYALTWDSLAEHSIRNHSISLLTIHGSKGLEYDAVAVVGLNDGTLPFFATEDMDEEKRKLYVAATRAGRALLLASDIESGNPESAFLAPVRALVAGWQ